GQRDPAHRRHPHTRPLLDGRAHGDHDRRGDGRRRGEQCAHDGGGRTPARGGRPGGGMNPLPRSTYRIQLTAEFPLTSAAELADYLRTLGADWFYLSPLLAATPGSPHGYDVVDHARVDPDRGGPDGLERLSRAARTRGMGVLVDIVPNHMGVGDASANSWWWDVLRLGQDSPHARFFDVDWTAGGGRVRIPVLGEPVADAAASGALRVEGDELHYYEHRYPLAPGTADDGAPAEGVHDRQHYELMHWTRADAELTYRRFFGVNELAAVRVELPEVLAATHREILRWIHEGLAQGLRVDHPDGLLDPGGYLDDLAEATRGCYVLVEKILEPGEQLPPFWATAGTTGYDALGDIDRVLVDPAGRAPLGALDARLRDDVRAAPSWPDLIHGTKRAIADGLLASEVNRLVREVRGAGDAAEHPDAEVAD